MRLVLRGSDGGCADAFFFWSWWASTLRAHLIGGRSNRASLLWGCCHYGSSAGRGELCRYSHLSLGYAFEKYINSRCVWGLTCPMSSS